MYVPAPVAPQRYAHTCLTVNTTTLIASNKPEQAVGARVQLLIVEIDKPGPCRSRVAGVFSDGNYMVAAEIDGESLDDYIVGRYYEGDAFIIKEIHAPTTNSFGWTAITEVRAPTVWRRRL